MATAVAAARTVGRVLQAAAESWADRPAARFEDADYSYAELRSRALRAARVFAEQGVRRGEPVLVMLDNCIEFVDAWLGLALLGAVQVPVNTEYLGEILRHQVRDSEARLMLADGRFLGRLEELGDERGSLGRVLVAGEPRPVSGLEHAPWGELFAQAPELPESRVADVAEHEPLAIMYTSGTTGPSKGVVVAHAHAHTYARLAGEAMLLSRGDFYFAPLPLFHIAGQWAHVYVCLQVGATAVVRRRFSATEFWPTVRESGARVSFLLGAMANFLARQEPRPDDADNPLERILMVPLVDDLDGFRRRFGVRVCTCYGSTEVSVPLISHFEVQDPTVAGRPVAGFQLSVVDEHDYEVPPGAVGELCVRTQEPWLLATGYHRNPEATARLYRNGWLHTGDAFRVGAGGDYHFVDRIKDYIRRRGENISSFELEREVNRHPAVLESAAVAVRSAATEDEVKVVVVLKRGRSLAPDELRDFLRGRVPKFMIPDLVEVVSELPKTPTGKIQKHLLR